MPANFWKLEAWKIPPHWEEMVEGWEEILWPMVYYLIFTSIGWVLVLRYLYIFAWFEALRFCSRLVEPKRLEFLALLRLTLHESVEFINDQLVYSSEPHFAMWQISSNAPLEKFSCFGELRTYMWRISIGRIWLGRERGHDCMDDWVNFLEKRTRPRVPRKLLGWGGAREIIVKTPKIIYLEEGNKPAESNKLIVYCFMSSESASVFTDPLEQFEVTSLGSVAGVSFFNNLAFILVLSLLVIFALFYSFNFRITNNYDYATRSVYQLVRSIVKENLYIKKQQYFSILFYLFVTILFANLIGLLPFSFTVTSSFVLTFFLALIHFSGVNIVGINLHGWELNNQFLPSGAPLAIVPFLAFIEAVSYIARVLSLSIRLFANIISGHALLKILVGFSWKLLASGSLLILLAILPWTIVTAVMFLELLIAFLQSYVFTILITLYINDVLILHD